MSAKTVALDPEAYELLRRNRRSGETFSDAVKRLSGGRRSILEYAGIWKEIPDRDLEKIRSFLREGRRRDRERMERLFRHEG
ncbi:MAG TPA: antitoxin VapB family protein [Thermoplasmata archaeon]|nr:antitoxin VapB family protein [Thermoplasmata archaeon]